MPLPNIRACVICEDFRPEVGKKGSLLGVFGVSPQAEIVIQNFAQPIQKLCFVLFGEAVAAGPIPFSVRVVDRHGHDIVPPITSSMEIPEPSRQSMFVFGFSPAPFREYGEYRLLIESGESRFEAQFRLSQGNPSAA
jgi:hypothetical protein